MTSPSDPKDHRALIIVWVRDVLHAKCGCGEDLGPSLTWDQSTSAHAEHLDGEQRV